MCLNWYQVTIAYDEKHFAEKAKRTNADIGFPYAFRPITIPSYGRGVILYAANHTNLKLNQSKNHLNRKRCTSLVS